MSNLNACLYCEYVWGSRLDILSLIAYHQLFHACAVVRLLRLCVFSPGISAQCTPLVPDNPDSGGSVAVCSPLSCVPPLFLCCRIVYRAGDFLMPSTRAITYPLPSTCFSICRRSSLFCTLVHLTHKSIQAMRLPAAYSSPPDLSTSSSASAVLRFGIDRHGDCLMC